MEGGGGEGEGERVEGERGRWRGGGGGGGGRKKGERRRRRGAKEKFKLVHGRKNKFSSTIHQDAVYSCTCTVQVTWNLYSSVECERLYSRV